MLPKADDYDELMTGFRWSLPDHYNIGVDVCDRHATGLPRTALIIENEDGAVRRYSFHDLRELTNRLANLFGAQGLVRGDRVAVMLQSLEVALTHIAAFKAGLISIPLFALFGEEALQYRLHNSGTRLLVTDRAGLEKLAVIRDRLPDLETVLCVEETNDALDFHGLLQEHSDAFTPVDTGPDDPAVIHGQARPGTEELCMVIAGCPAICPGWNCRTTSRRAGDLFWTPADWAWIGGLLDVLLPSLHHGVPGAGPSRPQVRPRAGIRADGAARSAQRLPAADRAAS